MKTTHERQYGRDDEKPQGHSDPAIGGDLEEDEDGAFLRDLEYMEFDHQVERIVKDLRSMNQDDLEAHVRAANLVTRESQDEAGHLVWISEWDAQCGCGWYSYCGNYSVSQDGCQQWAYTPEDVTCFRSMSGMSYCELHYQAKRLHKKWDAHSWDRFLAWRDSIEGTPEDRASDVSELLRMREWLSGAGC